MTLFQQWDRFQRSGISLTAFTASYLCVLRYIVELLNEYEGTDGHDDNIGITTLRYLLDAKTPVGSRDTYASLPKDRSTILTELFTYNWLSTYVDRRRLYNTVEMLQQSDSDWRTAVNCRAWQLAGECSATSRMSHLYGSCSWR